MMDSKELFKNSYEDIVNTLRHRQEYDIIRTSNIVRHFLFDNDPLINQVNRNYRLQLRFQILNHQKLEIRFPEEPPGTLRLHWKNLDPSIALIPLNYVNIGASKMNTFFENLDFYVHGDNPPVHIKIWFDEETGQREQEEISYSYLAYLLQKRKMLPILKLTKDQFLAHNCLFIEEKTFSVIDIMKMAAYIKGGIHSREPKTDEEQHLFELDKIMRIAGLDASLMIFVGLCNVIISGLRPLYNAITHENS